MGLTIGTIILWDNGNIPQGWVLCDGTNGTPDLRNRFILGAANNTELKSSGGVETHSHVFNASYTNYAGSHSHASFNGNSEVASSYLISTGGGSKDLATDNHTHKISFSATNTDADHRHTLNGTNEANNLPTHISLVYIMYTG